MGGVGRGGGLRLLNDLIGRVLICLVRILVFSRSVFGGTFLSFIQIRTATWFYVFFFFLLPAPPRTLVTLLFCCGFGSPSCISSPLCICINM